MTLVITEISRHGIAMAADSTVTELGKTPRAIPNAVKKLHRIDRLRAGISFWGLGAISDQASNSSTPTEEWIAEFLAKDESADLSRFVKSLAAKLNELLGPSALGKSRIGFHVAGHEMFEDNLCPSFYHVHDGPSSTLDPDGNRIDPKRINPNHDHPPGDCSSKATGKNRLIIRNGDFRVYATLFSVVEPLFRMLEAAGTISFPKDDSLRCRADYLVFQIEMISRIYQLSNRIPTIGGRIDCLTLSSRAIEEEFSAEV